LREATPIVERDLNPGLAVMLGGAAGTLARAGLAEGLPVTAFPVATLIANVAGSLLLGWIVYAGRRGLWRPLVGTGFCGALTTFSTLQVQLVQLVDEGRAGLALTYLAVSLVCGLAAVEVARRIAERPR
jgi:fluoride exporter